MTPRKYLAILEIKNWNHITIFWTQLYCEKCDATASTKICTPDKEHHVTFLGTKVRALLRNGGLTPSAFTRKEVTELLIKDLQSQ